LNTLIIGYNHSLHDKRVYRTVETFRKLGKVHYQYSGEISSDKVSNVALIPNRKSVTRSTVERIRSRFNFDKRIMSLVRELDYDIAYFHGFPSTMPTRVMKEVKKRGKCLIYDLHEIMPVQFLPERMAYLNPLLWNILKRQLKLCDGVVTVSDEAADLMFSRTKTEKPLHILPNYAMMQIPPKTFSQREREIVYVGKSSYSMIEFDKTSFVRILRSKGFRIKCIGTDWKEADISLPFLPYEQMMESISRAIFTLIAFNSRSDLYYKNDIYSLPNKFYDSLAAGTPVLVAERFVSMRKIVEGLGIGVVIDGCLPDELLHRKLGLALENYERMLLRVQENQFHFAWNAGKEGEFLDFVVGCCRNLR